MSMGYPPGRGGAGRPPPPKYGHGMDRHDQRNQHRGGRGRHVWSDRETLEREGLLVQTNCFKLTCKDKGEADESGGDWLFQYFVQVDHLKWNFDDKGLRTTLVVDDRRKSFFEEHHQGMDIGAYAAEAALDNRSSTLSRRILNKCQQDRGSSNQFFVRHYAAKMFVFHSLPYSQVNINAPPLRRFMMEQTLRIPASFFRKKMIIFPCRL